MGTHLLKSIFLISLVCLTSIVTYAHDFEVDGIYYKITDPANFEVQVTYKGSSTPYSDDGYSGKVEIPESVAYSGTTYSVTSIGNYAFRWCYGLTSVTIPNSVTSIGNYAFYECLILTSVTIPNSVTSIGNSAFEDCRGLKNITIGNSVTSIGNSAFYYCSGLTSVIIPNSVTSIGNSAFCCCSGLTSIVVEIGNTKYDSRENCNAIIASETNELIVGCKNTIIPNSVTSIGEYAFYECLSLTSVTIPNSVTSIRNFAFENCDGLKTIYNFSNLEFTKGSINYGYIAFYAEDIYNAPNGSVEGDYIFGKPNSINTLLYYIGNDTDLTLPDNYRGENYVIGESVFKNNTTLSSVTIPNSVTSIGNSAFNGCSGLTSVTIPNSVTSIGNYAFNGCSGLTSVTIPNSVTSIGNSAFNGCSGLTSVTIPNSVTSIGNYAFNGCSGLTSITIPNSVTSIGNYAFYECSGLTSVTIPDSVTSIGNYAFNGCSGLTSMVVETGNTKYDSRENCNAIIDSDTNELIVGCKNIIIPNSVTSIGKGAFWECSGLTSVTIPNSVTSIGNYAFAYCDGLTSIVVETGNTKYDSRENCNAIIASETNELIVGCKNTIIPNSVTSIGEYAFYECLSLTSVTIPNSVTSIRNFAFENCDGLKTIYNFSNLEFTKGSINYGYIAFYAEDIYNAPNGSVEGDYIFGKPNSINTLLYYIGNDTDLTLPDNYRGENYVIGESVFKNNTTLSSVTIPNSVTSIGADAFYGCSGLKSVTIGNSVTSIGVRAFYECSGLTSVTIGNSVTSIGDYVFRYCSGLTSIMIPNSVTSIGNNAFRDCSKVESLYISSAIETIGEYAFAGCTSIYEIQMASKKAITASENIFSTDAYNNAILYVPVGRTFAFEKASPWKNFYIQEKDYAGIEDIVADDNSDEQIEYFNLNGIRVENPLNGIFIRRQGNKIEKVIVK